MGGKMDRKKSLENRLEKLASIEEMPVLVEETRKFLTHFPRLLLHGRSNDEYLFQTLYLCETAFSKCNVAERTNISMEKLLSVLLQITNLNVCKKVLMACLETFYTIICHLDRSELVNVYGKLKILLSFLSHLFYELENFTIMKSILDIIYEYFHKYEINDRQNMFKKVMEDFKDPTGELSSILHWTPESFTINCRTFLNNIPGRKYYSLAAISAVLGTNVFNPLRGKNFISFEWNTNPSELTFQASFADDTDRSIQASIELSDIHCVKIIEDLNAPRVECSYEKIVIIGDSTETYDLKINASNNKELYELASFLKARIPSEKIVYKPLPPVVDDSEIILRHEKLYDTMEITHNGLQQHNDNCVIGDDIKDNESPAKELASIENGNEDESNFSNPDFPPLSTTKWPFKFIDLSDNRKKTDPYDLLHMREEEREQKRKQKKNNATGMGNGHGKKNEKVGNGTNAKNKKRPTYMESSTPTKRSRAAMIKTVPNDLDGISSIYNISDDEQSDNNDSDFVPYVMLSGAGNRNGRNKKQIKTQTQTFSTARRIGGRTRDMNVKQPAAKKALHTKNIPNICDRKTNNGKENKSNQQPKSNGSRKQSLDTRDVKHPCGREPLLDSPSTYEKANSVGFNYSERINKREPATGKSAHASSITPAEKLHENNASPLSSSSKNCDETLQKGMVLCESTKRTDTTRSVTRSNEPTCNTIQMMMESKAEPRIVNLQRYNSERMRIASNETQAFVSTSYELYDAFKAKYERAKILAEEYEVCYRQMMAIFRKSNPNHTLDELNRKRKEAEKIDKDFIQQVRIEKNSLQTIFQTSQALHDKQRKDQLAQKMLNMIYGRDANQTNQMLN